MKIYCSTDFDYNELRQFIGTNIWIKVRDTAYAYPRFEYLNLIQSDVIYVYYTTVYPKDFVAGNIDLERLNSWFEYKISHCEVSPYEYLFSYRYEVVLPLDITDTDDLLIELTDDNIRKNNR